MNKLFHDLASLAIKANTFTSDKFCGVTYCCSHGDYDIFIAKPNDQYRDVDGPVTIYVIVNQKQTRIVPDIYPIQLSLIYAITSHGFMKTFAMKDYTTLSTFTAELNTLTFLMIRMSTGRISDSLTSSFMPIK